jgi:calcium/calmodulin-dependent 3',5'-cyclic nucleotide phosphodiesterase
MIVLQAWLTDIEVLATLTAALIHDYEHTGTTNAFHINTGLISRLCHWRQ